MASSAGKRRRVAPARLSDEDSQQQLLKTEKISPNEEPKPKRARPTTKRASTKDKERQSRSAAGDEERAEGRAPEESAPPQAATEEKNETKEEQPSRFLERGLIYFFYRPKVGVEEVHDIDDVQKLFMLLIPKETMQKEDLEHRKHRLVVITKKKLPEVHSHARYWGFVDETSEEMKNVRSAIGAITYSTKTRGERRIEAARPVGRGYYGIISHGNHTHLAYVLELPDEPGEVQEAFNICKEGSYIVTVKNPEVSGPFGFVPQEREKLPDDLMAQFGDKRYAPLDPPSFLDYRGTEIIIIGASDDLQAELGKTGEQLEKLEEADVALGLTDASVFKELHLDKSKWTHAEPLTEGEWA